MPTFFMLWVFRAIYISIHNTLLCVCVETGGQTANALSPENLSKVLEGTGELEGQIYMGHKRGKSTKNKNLKMEEPKRDCEGRTTTTVGSGLDTQYFLRKGCEM